MIKALMGCYGVTYEEARDCDISGCNEMHVRADEANMISGILNISKAVSYVFDNGYDEISGKQIGLKTGDVTKFESFEEFYSAVIAQLTHLIDQAIGMARKYEHHVADVNPAIMLSATMKRALEKKVDAYAFGIKYPTSSILYNAYATTVDSILAVKELVFDKKEATISDFKNALDRNWQGYEWLREKALRADRKYGINDEMADAYASALHRWISIYITGQKNSRGSVYKTGAPSTLHFISQGKSTKATPDGRRMGEELSKNSAPVIGMERRGVTAVINSAIKTVPSLNSEAYVLDVMLHPSAVKGDDGLDAMCALVTSYMKRDGVSIQFNVFNAEMLRDAQQNPEKYKNLQVRISGWSILWNDLSKEEQDSYIIRAEGLGNG
jgi:formate C-acetyltransferase